MSSEMKVRKTDASLKMNRVREELKKIFTEKRKALERLVRAAEKAHMDHTNYQGSQTHYPNAKNMSTIDFQLVANDKFHGTRVSQERSTVHVPTDVYDQAPSILHAITWSSHLDKTFVANSKKDASLTWQFFCSDDAHLRIHPGVHWRSPSEDAVLPSDVYDCRVQEWYIQATTSAKDLIILLDVSGSMKGLSIEIAKTAVLKMLQTLTHDDFFNVILYSDQVEYLEPCFEGMLVQATEIHKERIRMDLDAIKPRNIANLEIALATSFELLLSGRKLGTSANCNKMIMLMTDGGVQACYDMFERYNATDNRIRIFTYLVGREVGESDFIKSLACFYNGSYYRISGFADVHEHIQRYLQVVSHQTSLGRSDRLAWSNTYYDVIEPGLGLVMTMSAPVYNSTSRSAGLLGVVGTDFPVNDLIQILNSTKIGVNAYWFVITNNGFTVIHPNLQPNPDFISRRIAYTLDLNRMEVLDTKGKLRKNMIRNTEGSVVMETMMTLTLERIAIVSRNIFYYSELENSPFRLGLSLPVGYGEFGLSDLDGVDFFFSTNIVQDLIELMDTNFTIARWNYCPIEMTGNTYEDDFLRYLINPRNHSIHAKCEIKLLEHFLHDVRTTKMVPDRWNKLSISDGTRRFKHLLTEVEFIFIGTQGGLTRYLSIAPSSELMSIMQGQASTTDALYYKLASHHGTSVITYISVPSLENMTTDLPIVLPIIATYPITDRAEKAVLAVVGVAIRQPLIEELLFKSLSGCKSYDDDDDGDDRCENYCDNFCSYENVSCFLIDIYGYVVYSGKAENIGSFLGEIDQMGTLMKMLTIDEEDYDEQEGSGNALFNRYTIVDFQTTCPIPSEQKSSAVIQLSRPTQIIISTSKYFVDNLLKFSMEISLLIKSVIVITFSHLFACTNAQSCRNRFAHPSHTPAILNFYENDGNSSSSSSSSYDESSEFKVLEEYLMKQEFEIDDQDLRLRMMECYSRYVDEKDDDGKAGSLLGCFKEAKAAWQNLNKRGNTTCFKRLTYYVANITRLPLNGSFNTCDGECERFYSVHLIPGTNLIFLSSESTCECKEDKRTFVKASQIKYGNNATYFCQILKEPPRDRISKCIFPYEKEFKRCSSAQRCLSSSVVLLIALFVLPLFIF